MHQECVNARIERVHEGPKQSAAQAALQQPSVPRSLLRLSQLDNSAHFHNCRLFGEPLAHFMLQLLTSLQPALIGANDYNFLTDGRAAPAALVLGDAPFDGAAVLYMMMRFAFEVLSCSRGTPLVKLLPRFLDQLIVGFRLNPTAAAGALRVFAADDASWLRQTLLRNQTRLRAGRGLSY